MTGATSHFNSYYLPMQSTIFDQLLEETQLGSSGKTYPESLVHMTTHLEHSWRDWLETTGRLNPDQSQSPAKAAPSGGGQKISTYQSGQARVWLMDRADALLGEPLMPSTSAWPSDGSGSSCSLSEVLEDGPLPTRYFLSSKAASGILRRAEARGKELPPQLQAALQMVAQRTEQEAEAPREET